MLLLPFPLQIPLPQMQLSNEHDQKSIACYKYICLHTEGNGDSKEQSDEIGQDVLGSV